MVEQQILITIATLAITLAGFSGVVGIFSKELSNIKTFKLRTLLVQSGIALFASLITLIASQAGTGISSKEDFQEFWVISSYVYISVTVLALIFPTIEVIKNKSYKKIGYDMLFYFSFFFVIALLAINAIYIQDAYLYHLALSINLGYAFISFFTLVMPSRE